MLGDSIKATLKAIAGDDTKFGGTSRSSKSRGMRIAAWQFCWLPIL